MTFMLYCQIGTLYHKKDEMLLQKIVKLLCCWKNIYTLKIDHIFGKCWIVKYESLTWNNIYLAFS